MKTCLGINCTFTYDIQNTIPSWISYLSLLTFKIKFWSSPKIGLNQYFNTNKNIAFEIF